MLLPGDIDPDGAFPTLSRRLRLGVVGGGRIAGMQAAAARLTRLRGAPTKARGHQPPHSIPRKGIPASSQGPPDTQAISTAAPPKWNTTSASAAYEVPVGGEIEVPRKLRIPRRGPVVRQPLQTMRPGKPLPRRRSVPIPSNASHLPRRHTLPEPEIHSAQPEPVHTNSTLIRSSQIL